MHNSDKIYRVGTLTYTKPKLAILLFWLLWGDFCYMLMEAVTPAIMPLKLHSLGASNTSMALILSTVPWMISMFLNPVISFKSDRFRSRWGRRIPFILFTLPFLVMCLVGMGFGDRIGFWLHANLGGWFGRFSPNTVAIGVIAILLVAFTFFNTFVNSVFWYLFNDVVPEHLLARFMSWFRMVSMIAQSIFNLFIFKHAESHTSEIFLGAGLLYLVGFGLMCLNVKEGEYPPPPEYAGRKIGALAAVKTYARECLSLWHYWYQFLITILGCIAGGGAIFMVFFYQETGLNLEQIGTISFTVSIVTAVLILGTGWLADRFHPIRVVLAGSLLNIFVLLPATMVWLFWHPPAHVAFWVWIAIAIGLTGPVNALLGVWDPPLFMRLFPRGRYGQFCSANALWRALGVIIGGVLVGGFLDVMKKFTSETNVYCFLPVWQLIFNIPATFLTYKLYRSWKHYGGDDSYVPPLPDFCRDEAQAAAPAQDTAA